MITNSYLHSRWNKIILQIQKERFVIIDRLETAKKYNRDFLYKANDLDVPEKTCPDDDVLYLSTSGSTGTPKIVSRSHTNLIAGVRNVADALGITNRDKFLSVVPFFYANGFSNCMFLPIMRGAIIVLMKQFSPRKMLHVMKEEKITILFGSPFIFSTITEIANGAWCVPSIRFCLSSGASMPKGLGEIFFSKFGCNVRQLYGSSETGTISIQLGDLTEDEKSVGKPLKAIKVKIITKNGNVLLPYESGEIIVRGPAMTKGYVGESKLNKNAFYKGYFRTGDVGMIDGHGNLYILGRVKRMINVAGVKVDPVEIENILVSFHKVREAFVVGVKNKRGIEIIKAVLVAQPDCKLNEVISYCKDKLADYKIPRLVEFRNEISRDIMGKVVPTYKEKKDGFSNP